MLEIKTFNFGPFQTNTYVISGLTSHSDNGLTSPAIIVDPACSNQYEQQVLYRYTQLEALQVQAIIATHGHLDHLWGAKWATEQYQQPVLMHEADIPMARAMQQQYNLFGIRSTPEPFPVENIKSKILNLKSQMSNLQLLETPGHTPGSICLYFNTPYTLHRTPILLSGDTLFKMGYGRTDLPGGDMGLLIDSLWRLFELPPDTIVYPGHGESTTIAAEKR